MSKKVIILLNILIIMIMFFIPSNAKATSTPTVGEEAATTTSSAGLSVDFDKYKANQGWSSKFTQKAGIIMGIIQVLGTMLAVVILISIGIKYMLGSSEEKAEYKKSMIPYIIGAFLLFASSAFVKVIYDLVSGI